MAAPTQERSTTHSAETMQKAWHEYGLRISEGSLRVVYNEDKTITFMKRHFADSVNSTIVNYSPLDIAKGQRSAADNPFHITLPSALSAVLRQEKTRIEQELKEDPTPNKFITEDIRTAYERARRAGNLTVVYTENEGVVFLKRRTMPDGPTDYGKVDLSQGLVLGTTLYPSTQPLTQGWWELLREKAEFLADQQNKP